MTQATYDDSADRFLDLACLAYTGADRPKRRIDATEILDATPALVHSSIYVAAAVGAIDQVRDILSRDPGAATRAGGPRDWEPLLYLAYGRVSSDQVGADPVGAARLLLDHGANPNASFSLWGGVFTALTGALGEGEQGPENQPPHPQVHELVELLLSHGAAANDPQGAYNRMHRQDDAWLRVLLAHGLAAEHRINWDMGDGPRPRTLDFLLSHAVDCQFLQRVTLLLAHGSDPNCRNPYNGRPIRTNAVLNGSTDVVQLLEQAGARVVPLTVAEQFRLALRDRDSDEARRLLQLDASCLDDATLLRNAAQSGDIAMVEMLVGLGAQVNRGDAGGVTALHKAAENGHVAVIQLLLSHGADPSIEDLQFNGTPVGWAEHAGQAAAVQSLRDHSVQ